MAKANGNGAAISSLAEPDKGGRPAWEPTAEQRGMVEAMAGCGVPQDDIAVVLDVDPKTLRKHCDRELKLGKIKANAKIGESLFQQAIGAPAAFDADGNQLRAELPRNVAAGIFWAKTQMGWKETTVNEHVGKDGAPLTPTLLYGPGMEGYAEAGDEEGEESAEGHVVN